MILGKYHCTIDEITYNRQELLNFYNQHKQHTMPFGDYMEFLSPWEREFKGTPGMNAVAVQKAQGKDLLDYDIINQYVNMFNFKQEIQPRDIDLLHYDPGFKFHPHTDHFMNCGIMFPILPDDAGEPISFYSRPGHKPERNLNYEKIYGWTDDDIEYNHYYSVIHPTLFNGMAIHGVPTVTQERVYLRIKVIGETFDSVIRKLKNREFIKIG